MPDIGALPPDPLLTVPEVARLLRLHPKTVYAMAAAGRLPAVHIGNRVRFDPRDIGRWMGTQKKGL